MSRWRGWQGFVQLPGAVVVHPEQSELGMLPGPTGLSDLRTLAISRLMLDNVPHIKAFWIMQGIGSRRWRCRGDAMIWMEPWCGMTSRALGNEGRDHQEMTVEQMHRVIREAGFVPVERDTLYREIVRQIRAS